MNERHCVVKYSHQGKFVGIVSGMGKHKGTWDYDHGKTQAYTHKRVCTLSDSNHRYVVETCS